MKGFDKLGYEKGTANKWQKSIKLYENLGSSTKFVNLKAKLSL